MPAATPRRANTAKPVVVTGSFESDGVELAYEVLGVGPRVIVYLPALLLNTSFNRQLARDLVAAGNRVVLLDPPGHGRSSKPRSTGAHRMDIYADHVVSLLDHLGVEEAVIGGMSLGANVALHVAVEAPDRVCGLVLEMPILGRGLVPLSTVILTSLIAARTVPAISRVVAKLAPYLPRTGIDVVDSVLESMILQPEEIRAILHGLALGPIAPTVDERKAITCPTLVIGVQNRIAISHPLGDAADLVEQVPNSRLVTATWLHELRSRPPRLTAVIADFLDEVFRRSLDPLSP